MTELLKQKAGETVLVTSASVAAGSIVGQIAKLKGCQVIAFVGNDSKIDWLKNELGFDVVLNYKKMTSVQAALKEHAPQGIDCYFDTVGGGFAHDVMECMNNLGRVAQCGSIASYNDSSSTPRLTMGAMNLRGKNLSVLGFKTGRWNERWSEGITQIRDWILEGKIKVRETVTQRFEKTPEAFLDLLDGENVGKQLVKA